MRREIALRLKSGITTVIDCLFKHPAKERRRKNKVIFLQFFADVFGYTDDDALATRLIRIIIQHQLALRDDVAEQRLLNGLVRRRRRAFLWRRRNGLLYGIRFRGMLALRSGRG